MTMPDNSEPTGGSPRQWMEDVNEQLDGLMDDVAQLNSKTKQALLVAAGAAAIAGLEGLGIATLFKGQKAIVETLQAIVNRLEPAPMTPEDIARAEAAMAAARGEPMVVVDQHPPGPVAKTTPMTVTEHLGDVAAPVETGNGENGSEGKHAAPDPSWAALAEEPPVT